jgi:hypothetical protein
LRTDHDQRYDQNDNKLRHSNTKHTDTSLAPCVQPETKRPACRMELMTK